jgi:hypothetical protein
LEGRPYKDRTVFGFANLLDPGRKIWDTVNRSDDSGFGISPFGLDEGEGLVFDYLIEGQYYSSTGARSS